ncbi:MAG: orotate phosphoribosyltransferase [Flavobacteriales bacterium]|jgi:orotate phosphoribosyltransferase|tara:strand:+ start:603 stop:1244 length:642 start_codon:yes stop_codon:yes gene_type:complete
MNNDNDVAKQIAKYLLQINAIILQPNEPFTWASGWKSPIYCDNRKILSFPNIRTHIRQNIAEIIKKKYPNANLIAGVATGGIAHGCLVAEELGLPFIYVRASAKEHGKQNLIEGYYNDSQSVVVIEDLISSGKSSLSAVKALEAEGLEIKGLISIFNYNFEQADNNFKDAKCEKTSLCDYNILINEALKEKYIEKKDIELLKEWRIDPSIWGN